MTTNGHALQPFLMDVALLSISPAGHGQLVKIHVTLKLHGIFGSTCLFEHRYAKRDEAAGRILNVEIC